MTSRSRFAGWLTGLSLGILAAPCLATEVPVVNPGFEDIGGESPVNEFTFGPLNGWDL